MMIKRLTLGIILLSAIMFFALPAMTVKAESMIPENAGEYNGHHYYVYNIGGTYVDAMDYCNALGGHLATITSKEENDFVFQYISNQGYSNAYFGYTDKDNEGSWQWITGEISDYTNWHSGEPNAESSNEDYAMFYWKFKDGTWNDGNFGNGTVSDDTSFICEWEVPEKKDLSSAVVSNIVNKKYTGNKLTQKPVVEYNSVTLLTGTDYTLSYKNNTNVGTATMIITGINNYTGKIQKTFKITSPGKVTIKFNANGGAVSNTSKKYSIGTRFSSLPKPSRNSYTFLGWYTAKTGGTKITANSIVTYKKTTTLYARWAKTKYTISFNKNNKNATGTMSSVTATYGKSRTLPANTFKRKGYSFVSWNTKADGSGKSYANKASVKNLCTGGKVTLYAQWKIVTYKITYELNGGKNNSSNPASYKVTTPTITLKNPSRTGYTFKGWYTNVNYETDTKVTEIKKGSTGNKTFYAKWTVNKYTIVFDKNNTLAIGTMADVTATYGKSKTLPSLAFHLDHYTFAGWNTKADGSGKIYSNKDTVKNLTSKDNGIVRLYAQWEPITYTIKYDKNDNTSEGRVSTGSMSPTKAAYAANDDKRLFQIRLAVNEYASRGYVFTGWNTKKDGSGVSCRDYGLFRVLPTYGKTITLYAQWKKATMEEPEGLPIVLASPEDSKVGFSYKCYFNEDYFSGANSEEKARSGLARLSACAALATYKTGQVKDFLETCGFEYVDTQTTGKSNSINNDNATIYMGVKPLADGSVLIAAIVSGYTDGGFEWISNFDLGDETIHRGFNNAAVKLYNILNNYLVQHGGDETKLWVTGHSRGGALANLLTIKIIDDNGSKLTNTNTYTYGFATPRYTTDKDHAFLSKEYPSIINYVSPHDFVPSVAPADWGYDRLGNNIDFIEHFEDGLEGKMLQKFKDYTGRDYKGYTIDEKNDLVDAFVALGVNQEMYSKPQYGDGSFSAEDVAKKGIGYALSGNSALDGAGYLAKYSAHSLKALIVSGHLLVEGKITKKVFDAHIMLTYLAWIDALYPVK